MIIIAPNKAITQKNVKLLTKNLKCRMIDILEIFKNLIFNVLIFVSITNCFTFW